MLFFDTHCHIDFDEFVKDREQVLANAIVHGVAQLLVPGVSLAQCKTLLKLSSKQDIALHKALGLHPYFLSEHSQGDFEQVAMLAKQHLEEIVAIGECGIDRSLGDLSLQQSLLQQHIELANELKLPLVVHHRQSHDLIAQSFKATPPLHGGVIHAFSGSYQVANYYIEQGFKLGVGGTITYERAQKTRDVVAQLNAEHLVLETDAPSMPLYGFQGKRNDPKKVVNVFDVLCKIKGVNQAEQQIELSQQLYSSSCSLFRI